MRIYIEQAEDRAVVALTLVNRKLLIANSENCDLKLIDSYSDNKKGDWAKIPSASTVAGMGACTKNGEVFVSTWDKRIYKFNRQGQLLDEWPVNEATSGKITITDDCDVVLAVRSSSKKIIKYSVYGEVIAEFVMRANILGSRLVKAVQISNGNFIISYGVKEDSVHGLHIINSNGHSLQSYGMGKDENVLGDPRDFVVDRLGNVFVADSDKEMVFLFDRKLNFVGKLLSTKHELRHPFGIHLSKSNSRLYVADNKWNEMKKKWTHGRIRVFDVSWNATHVTTQEQPVV